MTKKEIDFVEALSFESSDTFIVSFVCLFWATPVASRVPGPGMEPVPQQQPEPQ